MAPRRQASSVAEPATAAPNAYEQEREARIAANRARLVEMGIVASTSTSAMNSSLPLGVLGSSSGRPTAWSRSAFGGGEKKSVKRRPTVAMKPFTRAEPTRSSGRIRTLRAEGKLVSFEEFSAKEQQEIQRPRRRRNANVGGGEPQRRPDAASTSSTSPKVITTYAAPFSLRSIDVTVLSLGQVHRGAWRHKYWSSPGCLYHHAYPVGFRAVKASVFGREWECRVEEGEAGPMFVVESSGCGSDGGGNAGRRFAGPSPTRPWTEACLAHRTGQRISGPLFFGFSDPATQAAVEQLYSAEELEAARRGEGGKRREGGGGEGVDGSGSKKPSSSSSTERAALDFMSRYRIGEAAACVLAHTTALSGRRFASADELEAWAREKGGGGGGGGGEKEEGDWPPRAKLLLAFLLESEDFPASTRRWPAWRLRMAPRLVAAVCGLAERRSGEEGREEGGGGGERN